MIVQLEQDGHRFEADLSKPIDISIPLRSGVPSVNCFYAPPFRFEAVEAGSFIGDVRQGGAVNFRNVFLNPHGNGTHTECVGHITASGDTINGVLKTFHFMAKLVSVPIQTLSNGDRIVDRKSLEANWLVDHTFPALVLRTRPNSVAKCSRNYSGTNPPYVHFDAMALIVARNVDHLLIDLPSVDRENDGGKLTAHRCFWQTDKQVRTHATITELIYVPDTVLDGDYLLNIQIPSFELDAAPSKITLYAMTHISTVE